MAENLVQTSYLQHLANEDATRQAQVRTYRSYYEGDPPTKLTERQAEFLNVESDKNFGANVCAPIVDALTERLEVTGFGVQRSAEDESEEDTEKLAEVLDTWWQKNRMDAKQDWVHLAALRDAESFVIVGYDNDKKLPTWSHDYAFDGSNGVKVHYVPGTYNELEVASKRWIIDESEGKTTRRLNMYFPNRIEKWVSTTPKDDKYSELGWKPFEDDETELVELIDRAGRTYTAAVAWWTDTGKADGEPLGVPVIPFRNRDDGTGRGLSEIDNAIPLQDAINKDLIDQMAAGDMTGWQMYWTNGILPEGLKIYPGAMIPVVAQEGVEDASKAQVGVLAAGDLGQLINLMNTHVALLAGISGTPQSRFNPASVRPSADTQKQEAEALVAKAKALHKTFGNAWEDVVRMGLRVQSAFGEAVISAPDDYTISTQWGDVEVRNEREHAEAVAVKVERLDVPPQQGWKELGYSADERRDFGRHLLRKQSETRLAEARERIRQNGTQPEESEDETT